MQKSKLKILGIDPGVSGALVQINGGDSIIAYPMPLVKTDKSKEIDFDGLANLLVALGPDHIFLERALSFGMMSLSAFNYGRSFAAVEIAIQQSGIGVTYIEPHKWAKEMHAGIAGDLKPKAKSLIAAKRIYPKLFRSLPTKKNGTVHDGFIDALLIAGFGSRKFYKA